MQALKLLSDTLVENNRKKLTELGGIWISQFQQKDEGICHYFALFCANQLIKGKFQIDQSIKDNPQFLPQARHHFKAYDDLTKQAHCQTSAKQELKDLHIKIANVTSVRQLNLSKANITDAQKKSLEGIPNLLALFSSQYSEIYDREYIRLLTAINRHPDIIKINNELLPGMTFKEFKQATLENKSVVTDEIVTQLLPNYDESVTILIRDAHNYVLQENNKECTLVNQGYPNPHYISISFCSYQKQPALFIADANLGVVMFTNFDKFKQGLQYLLTIYTYKLSQPNFVIEQFNSADVVPRVLMKSSDWQAKFGASMEGTALPTATLMQQTNMPNWAKIILKNLSDFETKKNPLAPMLIPTLLQNSTIQTQIELDITAGKVSKESITQLQDQLISFFAPANLITKEEQMKALSI